MSILTKILTGAVAALPAGAAAQSYGKYESPAYVVEERLGEIEIRAYAPHIVAHVTVEGDRSAALSRGFRVLAGYIFGANQSAESVAMTSPVTQSERIDMTSPVSQTGEDGRWTITFSMPRAYTLATLPVPRDPAIRLEEAPAERQAALAFSGLAGSRILADREAELRAALDAAGIAYREPARYHFYDDPMTLPWKRRNEVSFVLAD